MQQPLFSDIQDYPENQYGQYLTAIENSKGVLDVDTVKGCSLGMAAHPEGGCYGECYAYKTASRYGLDFTKSISRRLYRSNRFDVFMTVKTHKAKWYRVGTAGDPCHDWSNTIDVLKFLQGTGKTPVIITKHWMALTDEQLADLRDLGTVVNTSVSALDTPEELNHRIEQIGRIKLAGIKSVARVVSCSFGETELGQKMQKTQDYLLSFEHVVDTPLRAPKSNKYAQRGDILLTRQTESVGGGSKYISLHDKNIYLGLCGDCPDQCGVDHAKKRSVKSE